MNSVYICTTLKDKIFYSFIVNKFHENNKCQFLRCVRFLVMKEHIIECNRMAD